MGWMDGERASEVEVKARYEGIFENGSTIAWKFPSLLSLRTAASQVLPSHGQALSLFLSLDD